MDVYESRTKAIVAAAISGFNGMFKIISNLMMQILIRYIFLVSTQSSDKHISFALDTMLYIWNKIYVKSLVFETDISLF